MTGIKNCTFGELSELVKKRIFFKHLHVFATRTGAAKRMVQFNSEDKQWKPLIIAHAVRASIGLPIIFPPHVLHFKDPVTGEIIPRPDLGTFMDGGLSGRLFNLPIEAFDRKKYVDESVYGQEGECHVLNKKTLAFSLYTPGEEIPKEDTNVECIVGAYMEWGDSKKHAINMYRQFNAYNQLRTIKISNAHVGTFLGFSEGEDKLMELVESGKAATNVFFARQEERSQRLEAFRKGERVEYQNPTITSFYMTYQKGLRESFILGVEVMGESIAFHTDYRLSFSPLTSQFMSSFSFRALAKHDARFSIFMHLLHKNYEEAELIFRKNARFFANCFEWIIFRKLLIESDSFEIVHFFLEKFPNWIEASGKEFLPLIYAHGVGAQKSFVALVKHESTNLDVKDPLTNKPILYLLAKEGHFEPVVEFCKEFKKRHEHRYQDMVQAKVMSTAGFEKTAYSISVEKGHTAIAEFLYVELQVASSNQPAIISEKEAEQILTFGPIAESLLNRTTLGHATQGIFGVLASATVIGLGLGIHFFESIHEDIRTNKAAKLEFLYFDDSRFKLFTYLGQGKIQEAEYEYRRHIDFFKPLMATNIFQNELFECLNHCDRYSDDRSTRFTWYISFFREKKIISSEFIRRLKPRYINLEPQDHEALFFPDMND